MKNLTILKLGFGIGIYLFCTLLISQAQVATGLDVLIAQNFEMLRGKRVGLITNQTGKSRGGRTTVEAFWHCPHLKLKALFAPEHGIDGKAPAGNYVPSRRDSRTGLPVYSLYGPTRKPTPSMLKGLDVLVFDIQDIGCRSYTYISTMGLAMQAAAVAGIEFLVLDRPNPLGGNRVEGPMLNAKVRSFVGQYEIPYVYGMTAGELARWINRSSWMGKPCRLKVMPMKGWRRDMRWEDTGLQWVPTSPNVPKAETALHYVATGWLGEVGSMDNGVGSDAPFARAGAGWLKADRYADAMNRLNLRGVYFKPVVYRITKGKWAGSKVEGIELNYRALDEVNLTELAPYLMAVAQKMSGRNLFQRVKADKLLMFDKVTGGSTVRQWLSSGRYVSSLVASWKPEAERFRKARQPLLLYP